MLRRLSLIVVGLLGACAQVAHETVAAPAATAAASAPAEPFSARLLGTEGCPSGQAMFAIPWDHSAQYDPRIQFIRAPDPVATCVDAPSQLDAEPGTRWVLMKAADGRYRVQSADKSSTHR